MTKKRMEGQDVHKRSAPEGVSKRMDEGVHKRSAADEADVEGHVFKRSAPEGVSKRMDEGVHKRSAADEADVEGHVFKRSAPEGVSKRMDEGVHKRSGIGDDENVEGHMIGAVNPVLARDLARAKEHDVQRTASRNNLVSEAKRANRKS